MNAAPVPEVLGRYAYFQEALTVASGPNAVLESGDSGAALIAEKDNRVVGLMTASSDLEHGAQTVVPPASRRTIPSRARTGSRCCSGRPCPRSGLPATDEPGQE